jgi:hypothetical protein
MWTLGAEVSCFGGGLSLVGVVVLLAMGEDARVGEETGLMAGASGRAGEAGFSA